MCVGILPARFWRHKVLPCFRIPRHTAQLPVGSRWDLGLCSVSMWAGHVGGQDPAQHEACWEPVKNSLEIHGDCGFLAGGAALGAPDGEHTVPPSGPLARLGKDRILLNK